MAQRAAVGAGEMYDMLRKRDLAVKRYEAAVAVDSGSPLAETARKRIKAPVQRELELSLLSGNIKRRRKARRFHRPRVIRLVC